MKIAQQLDGLGLIATEVIPKGSDLIVLPEHIPLRFEASEADFEKGSYSSLIKLAQHIPGMNFFPSLFSFLFALVKIGFLLFFLCSWM